MKAGALKRHWPHEEDTVASTTCGEFYLNGEVIAAAVSKGRYHGSRVDFERAAALLDSLKGVPFERGERDDLWWGPVP